VPHITPQGTRILIWLLQFWKICAPLECLIFYITSLHRFQFPGSDAVSTVISEYLAIWRLTWRQFLRNFGKHLRACMVLTQTVSNSEDLKSFTPTLKPWCHWYIAVAVLVRKHTSSADAIYVQNHKDNVHWTSAPLQMCNTPRCNLQRCRAGIPMYCKTHLTKSRVLKIYAFWQVWTCRQASSSRRFGRSQCFPQSKRASELQSGTS